MTLAHSATKTTFGISEKKWEVCVPNQFLFHASCFFAPFLTLGLSVSGTSIYFCFIIILLDLRFWASSIFYKISGKAGLIVLITIIGAAYVSLRSDNELKTLLKLSSVFAFLFYQYRGFLFHSESGLKYGIIVSCLISIISFFELNTLGSNFLDPRNFVFEISETMSLNIQGTGGGSNAPHSLIPSISRVAGTAVEPGHFSAALFCMAGLVRIRSYLGFLIFLAALASFSKVSFLFVIFLGLASIASKLHRFFFPLMILLSGVGYFAVGGMVANLEFRLGDHNITPSIKSRVEGTQVIKHLYATDIVLGTGIQNTCRKIPPDFAHLYEDETRFSSQSKQTYCPIGHQSFWGSLVLEQGIVGAFILSFILVFLCLYRRTRKLAGHPFSAEDPIWYFWFGLMSLFACHYLTFFPIVYVVFARGMSMTDNSIHFSQVHISRLSGIPA